MPFLITENKSRFQHLRIPAYISAYGKIFVKIKLLHARISELMFFEYWASSKILLSANPFFISHSKYVSLIIG